MAKTTTITLTQAQLDALVKKAVQEALTLNSTNSKGTKGTSKKKTTSKKAQKDAPKTKAEAIEKKYGDADARKAYVQAQQVEAHKFLKQNGFIEGEDYTLSYGKVSFAPHKELVGKCAAKFTTRKDYSKFRDDFRKQFPYA